MAVSSTVAAMVETMERWLTPAEFVGALKLGVALHNASGRTGPGAKHYERAAWYQARLVEFMKRTGFVEIEPPPVAVYWTEDQPEPTTDYMDLLISAPMWEPIPIHSDFMPHVRWLVRIPIADADGNLDGEEIETFASHADAQAYCDSAKAEEQEAIDKATGRLDAEPVDLPALPRGHSALIAAAGTVIEDGLVRKSRDEILLGMRATRDFIERADLVIENGRILYQRPGLLTEEAPIVPRQHLFPAGTGA